MTQRYKNLLIFSHPDDELLWSSSWLRECDLIIICFGPSLLNCDLTANRASALAHHPFKQKLISLNIAESNVLGDADWTVPNISEFGLSLKRKNHHYENNFRVLIDKLRPYVTSAENIITHNPWGEYGHEEHVQVYRAVSYFHSEHQFNILYNLYVSDRSLKLMLLYESILNSSDTLSKSIDQKLSNDCMGVYIESGAWTWPENYIFHDYEFFVIENSLGKVDQKSSHMVMLLNMNFSNDITIKIFIKRKLKKMFKFMKTFFHV